MTKAKTKTESAAQWVPIGDLTPWSENPRKNEAAVSHVAESIERFGFASPIIARTGGEVIAGHTRLLAAQQLGLDRVPVRYMDLDPVDAKLLALADNKVAEIADWDDEALERILSELRADGVDLDGLGWTDDELAEILNEDIEVVTPPSIRDVFGIPPFSVLDSRQGYWLDRKKEWLSIGIQSEIGRDEGTLIQSLSGQVPNYYLQKTKAESKVKRELSRAEFEENHLVIPDAGLSGTGTSVFDPVLCEIAYRWFSTAGSKVLDPFGGGSVRGVVAGILDRSYTGVDLREEQTVANRIQWADISKDTYETNVSWITGDSATDLPNEKVDLVFSCPPYFDLEVYSDKQEDLSTMDYPEFLLAYQKIISEAVERLNDDRFIVWVIGEVRDKKGIYRGFVPDTIRAFEEAGALFYNEAILVTPLGSVPMRIGRQFKAGRKFGKTHQNVLVFVKGDPKKATEYCGTIETNVHLDQNND